MPAMSDPRARSRRVFVYEVDVEAGRQRVVTLVEPDLIFEAGLCPEAILGVLDPRTENDGVITPENFQQNRVFVEYLRTLIGEHICDVADVRREAERQGDGNVYILDGRTRTPHGAVPPVDVLGAVAASSRNVVPGSYRHNPNHRLLTTDGFFVLPRELETVLQNDIRARRSTWPAT
jgi:hypothetical protein